MNFMKRFVSRTVSTAIFRGRQWLGAANENGQGLRILTYHRVCGFSKDRLSVHPEKFVQQMEWLSEHGYVGVSMGDLPEALKARGNGNPESAIKLGKQIPIVLTFDDGYVDIFDFAFPILRKYGHTATVYLISGFVGTNKTIPRYEGSGKRIFMNWDEVTEMAGEGFEFGSHTVSHPRLTEISREAAAYEIRRSKELIEEKLGRACKSFCYPGGMWNESLEELVRAADYRNASTVMPGLNSKNVNPFRLRRTEISGHDSLFDFEKKIAGAFDLLHNAWQKVGLLK